MPIEAKDLTAAFSRLIDLTSALKFSRHDPHQLYAVCLYARMLELGAGALSLLRSGVPAGIPVLVRTLLEAYADLRCLLTSRSHLETLVANNLKERVRVLKAALRDRDPNPILQAIASYPDSRVVLSDFQRQLAALKEKGSLPLRAEQTFQRAGLTHEYEAIYWSLCLDSHNNLSALEKQHLRSRAIDGDLEVVMLQRSDLAPYAPSIDLLLSGCINAHERLREFLGAPVDQAFLDVVHLFREVRRALPEPDSERKAP